MKSKSIIFTLFAFVFSITIASAQSKVTDRQVNQQKRIHQGVISGELTKVEVKSLQKQQKNVQKHKKAIKSDGIVTKKEKASIRARQSKTSKNIYGKKHNNRNRN